LSVKVAARNSLRGFGQAELMAALHNLTRAVMRRLLLLTAASAIISISTALPQAAAAMTPGAASGVQDALAATSAVESVVRVCRHRFFTSRRVCWIDRSRPPTVCHRIRGTNRLDCY
jgi:hypothetical protein